MTTPNFVNLAPQDLTERLARGAEEQLLTDRMCMAVAGELGRPLTPAELADVHASATALVGELGRYARLPDAEQRALAREMQDEDGPREERS